MPAPPAGPAVMLLVVPAHAGHPHGSATRARYTRALHAEGPPFHAHRFPADSYALPAFNQTSRAPVEGGVRVVRCLSTCPPDAPGQRRVMAVPACHLLPSPPLPIQFHVGTVKRRYPLRRRRGSAASVVTRRAARRAERIVMAWAASEPAPASPLPLPLVPRQIFGAAAAAPRTTPGPSAYAEGVRK